MLDFFFPGIGPSLGAPGGLPTWPDIFEAPWALHTQIHYSQVESWPRAFQILLENYSDRVFKIDSTNRN